ncbi:thiamine pyrophosphate-dependent enzyme [Tardiphaga sp. 42S5]|uniref:thiamine pyrophosphate-dependent enzyme n=1 Tax=Tardiphaga sp. 42S5 TaxID=1404799 RepID=UPI002A5A4C72|nr:thiamine pyrophosphate-dependent enzyme [Tardiphaga sp. 42S5]WPO43238.1 thiamine pyrophosphate-binding protein [Tardiphaga sp. 42S5]
MKQTGGMALASQLALDGVKDVFAIPGIQLDWAFDGLRRNQASTRVIVPRHEQATSYMADGYARTTGRLGVCMVVPGPGVLNAMAGLATAYACNSRVVCIAGDINSSGRGKGVGLLHEINGQTEILAKVTKWQGRATSTDEIAAVLHETLVQAASGQPKPVAFEVAQDLLNVETENPLVEGPLRSAATAPDEKAIFRAAELLDGASFPVIYVGGGALASESSLPLAELAERLDAPIVMGENGRGAVSDRHALALNALGGRAVFPHADVVVVVGSRFVDTQVGKPAWPSDRARYIYINLDESSWNEPRRADVAILADAALGLKALSNAVKRRSPSIAPALKKVRAWSDEQANDIQPQAAWLQALRKALPDDGFFVNELTQVGYLGRFHFPVYGPNTFITPGYQGTLGFGLPTALGVAVGNPDKAVLSINGDGGFGWNSQELATAKKYNLNVAIVIFNDGHFGNVRTMQKDIFGSEFNADLCNPDFAALAGAYGIPYQKAATPEDLVSILKSAFTARGPAVIEVPVGEMPSPWHLMRLQQPPFAKAPRPAPPNPLGEPAARPWIG